MNKKTRLWQLFGFAFVSFFGTALHFLYDFAQNNFTALFSGVNESTWEHMKLFFFPALLFAVVEYFIIGKEHKCYWRIKLFGTVIGLLAIPVLFYTVRGAFGETPDFVNIAIFFVSVAVAFLYETHAFEEEKSTCKYPWLPLIGFGVIAAAFFLFTFYPPNIPLFLDPVSGTYGI